MASTLLTYLFLLTTGVCLEGRSALNHLLSRVLVVLAVAWCQLMATIQGLSLLHKLNEPWLLGSNMVLTGIAISTLFFLSRRTCRLPWRDLVQATTSAFGKQARKEPLSLFPLCISCSLISWAVYLSFLHGGTANDPYHFEMAPFWIQNETIAPFEIANPRIVCCSFAAEAMALPGNMGLKSHSAMHTLGALGLLLVIWIVYSLAREIGTGFSAALCAASITPIYGPLIWAAFGNGVEIIWAGAWAGASLLFLLRSNTTSARDLDRRYLTAASVVFFCLASGAKNSTLLSAPLFAAGFALVIGKRLWQPRHLVILAACALAGLALSGVAWNYSANWIWFGDYRGSALMKEHLAQSLDPLAVWTRACRGIATLIFDTTYLPGSAKPALEAGSRFFLALLGANRTLPEDVGFWSVREGNFGPGSGLGLLGVTCFLPGIAVAIIRSLRPNRSGACRAVVNRRGITLFLLVCAGTFMIGHALLRWQSIGVIRLLPVLVISGAPLVALLATRRPIRTVLLLLQLGIASLYASKLAVTVAQREDVAARHKVFGLLLDMLPDKSITVHYQWKDEAMAAITNREVRFSYRQFYEIFLNHFPEPTTIGVIGKSEAPYLLFFGPHYRNRVIPLTDCRHLESEIDPPPDCRFIAVEKDFMFTVGDSEVSRDTWAQEHDLRPVLRVIQDTAPRLTIYEQAQEPSPSSLPRREN